MGDEAMAYAPQPDEPEVVGARRGPPAGGALDNLQRRFLRAGRILVAGGCLMLTHTGSRGRANAEHAIVGLALLLLGVFLIFLSPVANRFPGAARVGAAVLFYFFAPEN